MQKINSVLVILISLSCLRTVNSVDLFVDASLLTAAGNTYPSLSDAITHLMSGNLDPDNTITLNDSCLTFPQAFPSGLYIEGNRVSITIQYLANQTVEQAGDCQLLPVLIISGDQAFKMTDLVAFSLIGLNIQYYGSATKNEIFSIEAVSFSNFCFNNSEPTLADPSSSYPSDYTHKFYLWSLSSFSMENGVWLFDGFKEFSVADTLNTTVTSVVFVALNSTRYSYISTFYVGDWYWTACLFMSNIQLICDTQGSIAPIMLVTYGLPYTTLTGFTISNLFITEVNYLGFLSIEGAGTVILDNFTFYNTTYPFHNYMLWIDSAWNGTLSNFNIDSSNITTLIAFNDDYWGIMFLLIS